MNLPSSATTMRLFLSMILPARFPFIKSAQSTATGKKRTGKKRKLHIWRTQCGSCLIFSKTFEMEPRGEESGPAEEPLQLASSTKSQSSRNSRPKSLKAERDINLSIGILPLLHLTTQRSIKHHWRSGLDPRPWTQQATSIRCHKGRCGG